MDEPELLELLRGGETLTVEFKSQVNDTELVEAVICLANSSGGHLLVGVDDSGHVTGAEPRQGTHINPQQVSNLITNTTRPYLTVLSEVVSTKDGDVIVIRVPQSDPVVSTSKGKYLRRALDVHGKPQCLPMALHEVIARSGMLGTHDYARVPLPNAELGDLSPHELDRYRALARTGGDEVLGHLNDTDLLKALEFISAEGVLTVGSLLLFGTEAAIRRHLPVYELAVRELDEHDRVLTNEINHRPLLRAMEEITEWIKPRNPEEEIHVGLLRIPLPRFAEETIRELVANALVHRDYTANVPTQVELKANTLSVFNPGGFPEGFTMANFLTQAPRWRNPALANAFKRAGLVERVGRGIKLAFRGQLAMGRPPPDYSKSTRDSVEARVHATPANTELAAYIAEANQRGEEFRLEDLLVLHEVHSERQITAGRAAELLQVGVYEARNTLNRLVEQDILKARGEGRGRAYHLSAALFRRLGKPAHYVLDRGFNKIQHEQMVLTYVEQHGRITRREASELCKVDPLQAGRLLRHLRDEGKLTLVGEKRGAYYMKASE